MTTNLGGVPTPTSTRKKNRSTKRGRTRSHVKPSKWKHGTSKDWSIPPVKYGSGPFSIMVEQYRFRFWGIRGDQRDVVLLTEVESAMWDDATAVMTGTLTYMTPDWAKRLGLSEGHKIRCEWSDDYGSTYHPLWTMRLDAPTGDLMLHERTANLVSDLNRLQQSDDDFVFAKGKRRPKGWRADKAIRFILEKYGFTVAAIPAMTTHITNWHLTDVHPLDVIQSILLRERRMAGNVYALSLDWRERVHVRPLKRPTSLLEVGPQLLAITQSATHNARFATVVTARADAGATTNKDPQGHRKVSYTKTGKVVTSHAGVRLFGYIHRNVYSPDATSIATLTHEGKLFLAEVAKYERSVAVTLPGMPRMTRLDAFRVKLPDEGINHIVYVADAKHTVDARGYTVDATMIFNDPFTKDKSQVILTKLTDSASARSRPLPGPKKTGTGSGKKPPKHKVRQTAPLGGVQTPSGARATKG